MKQFSETEIIQLNSSVIYRKAKSSIIFLFTRYLGEFIKEKIAISLNGQIFPLLLFSLNNQYMMSSFGEKKDLLVMI